MLKYYRNENDVDSNDGDGVKAINIDMRKSNNGKDSNDDGHLVCECIDGKSASWDDYIWFLGWPAGV